MKALKVQGSINGVPAVPDDFPQRLEYDFANYHNAFIERYHEIENFQGFLKKYNLSEIIPAGISRWTNAFRWKVRVINNSCLEI